MQAYFGYFGNVWLYITKMIVQLLEDFNFYLHAKRKVHHFTSSLRYYILKNLAILLADSIWAHNWRPSVLPDMELVLKYK